MIEIIKGGNILEAKEMCIAHQTNCQGVMGSGVALAIRNKYPKHYQDFTSDKRSPDEKLGSIIFTSNHEPQKFIYGLYGQLDYRNRNIRNTSYPAFGLAISKMIYHSNSFCEVNDFALPYLIGADLAGGDWNVIYDILLKLSEKYQVNFHLYDLFNKSEDNNEN